MRNRITYFITLLFILLTCAKSYAESFNVALIKTKEAFSYNETSKGYLNYTTKSKIYKDNERIHINVDEYNLKGDESKAAELIEEIEDKEYDIIVTLGRRAFESVKDKIKDRPIIFATMFNPYNSGGQPDEEDANVVGIEMDIPVPVQFENLKSFIPYLQNIGVIYSASDSNRELIASAKKKADDLGLTLIAYEVNDESNVASVLDTIVQETDALWMIPDYAIFSKEVIKHVVLTTIENEIPFMGISKAFVKAGALFAVTRDFEDIGMQAAKMTFDIIKDGVPDEKKVIPLRKYPVVINKRTAESIDLRIPQWVSENAIEFFE